MIHCYMWMLHIEYCHCLTLHINYFSIVYPQRDSLCLKTNILLTIQSVGQYYWWCLASGKLATSIFREQSIQPSIIQSIPDISSKHSLTHSFDFCLPFTYFEQEVLKYLIKTWQLASFIITDKINGAPKIRLQLVEY